ncbi:MAG: extracellular solute-binding protein [Lachnospiraceae bacterium]|nr:extracellular solute-binding protein [Lachnospiraceae bacterium]
MRKRFALALALAMTVLPAANAVPALAKNEDGDNHEVVLRVCNWEEYIDEGGWEEDELIELDNDVSILGENSMVEDFEEWYFETYGRKVRVEYSTFGTNEELYNMLTLGDVYDVVCPSDYLLMRLMSEGKAVPFSDHFYDETDPDNYYARGVSDYIRGVFEENEIDGKIWADYAAGYMWGTTGIVYNPEYVTEEEASSWQLFTNPKFSRRVTIKDNVRDSMFAALGIVHRDRLMSEQFRADPEYSEKLAALMNDTSINTVDACEEVLRAMKENAYSFETDSGKSDMVIGRVWANYQWSGDAVYSLDQAEEDGVELYYRVPEECSNLWFDGWIILQKGISQDPAKQHAAEAWINFLSRPDNAVRNMYYIGYTSTIAGGEDDTVFEYMNWCYGAEEDDEEAVEYDVSYFFGEDSVISADASYMDRQLIAQYPTEEIIERCAVMGFFDDEEQARINRMWINVRCFTLKQAAPFLIVAGVVILLLATLIVIRYVKRQRIYSSGK